MNILTLSSIIITRLTPTVLQRLPKLPPAPELDDPPWFSEVLTAVRSLKDNKSAGPDGIPAEPLKNGWKDSHIVTIHKKKGDKSIYGNSRGISLHSVAGKVLARVMLVSLTKNITERILPESQCGFRKDRSTSDMIFVLRQLQEKAREQNKDLFIAFIDLAKTFDTIDRHVLWVILEKFGVPPRFLDILQQFHVGMQARVIVGTSQSSSFPVQVGVKHGCVLAPVIFNLFLAAVTLLSRNSVSPDEGVCLQFHLDGNLFKLRRLEAITKTTTNTIHELQYADDCALLAHSPTAMQHKMDIVYAVYQAYDLQVNIQKTEIIAQTTPTLPEFYIHGTPVKVVQHFCYLGSILTPTCLIDNKIQARINLTSFAFSRLRSRVFVNKDLRTFTKAAVYQAVYVSTLQFGAEAWTPYCRHIRCLEDFHIRCLQRILGVTWKDKIPHTDILQRTNSSSMEATLARWQLRWVGHVICMPSHRLVLYGQIFAANRRPGGQKHRYKDHLKGTLKSCDINPGVLETTAANRQE